MSMTVACPSCSRELAVPDRLLGQNVKCPKCATLFQVGTAAPPADQATVVCQSCSQTLQVPLHLLGKMIECVHCETLFLARASAATAPVRKPAAPPPQVTLDDHEEAEPERPIKKKKRKQNAGAGSATPLIVGGVLAAVFVLAGLAMWLLWPEEKPERTGSSLASGKPGANVNRGQNRSRNDPPPERPPQQPPPGRDGDNRGDERMQRPGADPDRPPPRNREWPMPNPHEGKTPPSLKSAIGLMAYWAFDEANAGTANDASSNGFHARETGTGRVPGVRGTAYVGDGRTSMCEIPNNSRFVFPQGAAFTISGWFQTLPRGVGRHGVLLAFRADRDMNPVIDIFITTPGQLVCQVRSDQNANKPNTVFTAPDFGNRVDDGKWHHFALVRQTDGRIELYVDGNPLGSEDLPENRGAITTDLQSLGAEWYWIRHQRGFPIHANTYYDGFLDELAVFNRALELDEIRKFAGLD